jgi:phospho-N-acetylmuramoyl-pentapeptide-transferase
MFPFINFLFRMKFARGVETEEIRKDASKNFYKIRQMHAYKVGVLTGGGILVALVVAVLFVVVSWIMAREGRLFSGYPLWGELTMIFFTFVGFGILGLYDDIIKIFGFAKAGFFGLRMRHKFAIQWILATISGIILYFWLGVDIINLPFLGQYLHLEWMIIPVAAFLIVTFANAFDITDGLDGLSGGLLMICLLAFWVISLRDLDHILLLFIALWTGSLIAYLYFNLYPARIMLGNVGGLAFGATLAVVGLLSGKVIALLVIGGIFLAEGGSSMLQLLSKKFMKYRLFPIAPLHHWLQLIGWEEPKIVYRAWLAGLILAIFGVWLAVL